MVTEVRINSAFQAAGQQDIVKELVQEIEDLKKKLAPAPAVVAEKKAAAKDEKPKA